MDDEPLVGRVVARVLSGLHEVVVAQSARQALDRIAEGGEFDVILCDLMMPGMSGIELHAEIAAMDPALAQRMIFLSGGAYSPEAREFLDSIENTSLDKPFTVEALRELVNARVDARG